MSDIKPVRGTKVQCSVSQKCEGTCCEIVESFLYMNTNIFLDLARNSFKLGFHTTCQIKKEVQIKEGKVLTLYCMREIEVNWHMNIYVRNVLLQALGLRFKQ